MQKKKVSKPRKKVLPPRIKLFSLRMHYLTYLLDESYKYYLDFQDNPMDDGDSQILFTSHFFNNHVDRTRIDSRIVDVYQDNLNQVLDEITMDIVRVSLRMNIDCMKVIREFLDTQVHIEEQDFHKITNLRSFIEKRAKISIEINNHINQGLRSGALTQEDLADIMVQ